MATDIRYDKGIIAVSAESAQGVITFFGLNLTDKKIRGYRMNLASINPLTKSLKNFDGVKPEFSVVKTSSGKNGGVVRGQYTDPEMEMTVEIRQDFNGIGLTDDNKYGVAKDLLQAIFSGGTFKHGSDLIRVVSCSGVVIEREEAEDREMNLEFGNLFSYEVGNLFAGAGMSGSKKNFNKNYYNESYKAFSNCIMLESREKVGSRFQTLRMANFYPTLGGYAENSASENTITVEGMKCGEFWSDRNLIVDALPESEADDALNKINYEVDYIVYNTVDPTDFGTAGDKACVVNRTTGAFAIKESDGASTWNAVATGTFKALEGRIRGTYYTEDTIANAILKTTFVSVKTAGADNSGIASNFAYNSKIIEEAETGSIPSSVVTPSQFICEFYDYDRNVEDWVASANYATGL